MKPSILEKRGSLVRLSILVQNGDPSFQTNIGYISRGGHLLFGENGGHSVRAFISKKKGVNQ